MAAPVKDSIALYAKLQSAEEHIFKLKESWDVFIEEDSFPVRFQDTPDGRYRMYYLGPVAPIRVEFPLMTGDVIHNLRSALDHWPTAWFAWEQHLLGLLIASTSQ